MAGKPTRSTKSTKPVLVTTAHRGVFFGFLEREEQNGETVVLTDARCAIRWRTTGGFLELASKGPNVNSKIGDTAPRITLYKVTSLTECTPEAAEAWRKA